MSGRLCLIAAEVEPAGVSMVAQPMSLRGGGPRTDALRGRPQNKSKVEAERTTMALPSPPSDTFLPSQWGRSQRVAGLNHRGVTTWKRGRHRTPQMASHRVSYPCPLLVCQVALRAFLLAHPHPSQF